MLFVVDKGGVPSVGKQLRLSQDHNDDDKNNKKEDKKEDNKDHRR